MRAVCVCVCVAAVVVCIVAFLCFRVTVDMVDAVSRNGLMGVGGIVAAVSTAASSNSYLVVMGVKRVMASMRVPAIVVIVVMCGTIGIMVVVTSMGLLLFVSLLVRTVLLLSIRWLLLAVWWFCGLATHAPLTSIKQWTFTWAAVIIGVIVRTAIMASICIFIIFETMAGLRNLAIRASAAAVGVVIDMAAMGT